MSTILEEIEAQIAGVKTAIARQNVGIVREIGDGVAKIEGLADVMMNEMIDFGHGVMGLALNMEATEVGMGGKRAGRARGWQRPYRQANRVSG
jgi:F-type H+-transporting ATPase subunit alpha